MPTMYQFASATPYIIIIVSMLVCVGIGSTLSSKKDSKHAWNTTYNDENI